MEDINHLSSFLREGVFSFIWNLIIGVIPGLVIVSFFTRKAAAIFQARVGPSRAGPRGVFQGVVDFLKVLQKDDGGIPGNWLTRDRVLFYLWFLMTFSILGVLPMESRQLKMDSWLGVFFVWISMILVSAIKLLLTLDDRSPERKLGSLRNLITLFSVLFPSFLAVLSMGVVNHATNWSAFLAGQNSLPFQWGIFSDPFQWISFLIFLISGMILFQFPPFQHAVSKNDLLGGVHSFSFGRRGFLINFQRSFSLYAWCMIAVNIFCGAWLLPESLVDFVKNLGPDLFQNGIAFFETFVLVFKTTVVMSALVLIGPFFPNLRTNQTIDFAFGRLVPIMIVTFVLVSGFGLFIR